MRLHRLRVFNFAAVQEADLAFGPGLNVLHGPNDLGKSTLVDAIRLALLLPYTSSYIESFIPWAGATEPVVEITFETEAQRIWRIRKEFGKAGSATLSSSRNGRDFEEVERGRRVDATVRDILRWGIPEPGGSGAAKGLQTSFLATALLSTQGAVADLLGESLADDPATSGRDRLSAALQAVAQDPLFVALLHQVQERRDEAYTDRGAKKTAKGSVFKAAADRVNETRDEKERLAKIVADSRNVEVQLRTLATRRAEYEGALASATAELATVERLAKQLADRTDAAEMVRGAREEVLRIQRLGADVAAAETRVGELAGQVQRAEQALERAQARQAEIETAFTSAEEAARAETSDPALADAVARQALELRKGAADQAAKEAQERIERLAAVQKLIETVVANETEHDKQSAVLTQARQASSEASSNEKTAAESLQRCDLLEKALDVRLAERRQADARTEVEKEASLRKRLADAIEERATFAGQRTALTVPASEALAPLRKLSTDLAAARGALDVGIVVTVTPTGRPLDLRIRKDGAPAGPTTAGQPVEIEANSEVEIVIQDVATVEVRGGRRDAQEKVRGLEARWTRDVAPLLNTAGATDLEGLENQVEKARGLDERLRAKDVELETLRRDIASLEAVAATFDEATRHLEACRTALGVPLETLAAELSALGADPAPAIRAWRQGAAKDLESARAAGTLAATDLARDEERLRNLRSALEASITARDEALAAFPEGVSAALSSAQAALSAALAEQRTVEADTEALASAIGERRKRLDERLTGAREAVEQAKGAVATAQNGKTNAIAAHAAEVGRLDELRKLRQAEDLPAAEGRLRDAMEQEAVLPIPERTVEEADVAAARAAAVAAKADIDVADREIERAHGALEQVGGAVARERLRDAMEAFELAQRYEQEVEADYEAWRLLLDQMKEADAAQASNLGQALGPVITTRFRGLTEQRYQGIGLTAELGTEGVVVAGIVRPPKRISIGTREQLSTLYRLCLAEYLRTTVVLDDQLVQSDDMRMDWFRALLNEKARAFQIVVLTCRPADYLGPNAVPADGCAPTTDTADGFVRAVDLARLVRRV